MIKVNGKIVYKELVLERIGSIITASDIEEAKPDEFAAALEHVRSGGVCDHHFVVDEYHWLYDIRSCAVCGIGLGTV